MTMNEFMMLTPLVQIVIIVGGTIVVSIFFLGVFR